MIAGSQVGDRGSLSLSEAPGWHRAQHPVVSKSVCEASIQGGWGPRSRGMIPQVLSPLSWLVVGP